MFKTLYEIESVQRWLRRRAELTKAEYLTRMDKFLVWSGPAIKVHDPDGFLAWAKKQPSGVHVQDLIDKYTEGMKPSTAHVHVAVLRGFLNRNGYRELPKIDWESTMSFAEGYTRQQIQELLGYLDRPLQKLYVLSMKDSGLRANDLLYLRYKHIKPDLEAGKDFVNIRFEDERYKRRKAPGLTFLGPNSVSLLRELLKSGEVKRDPDARIFPYPYRTITYELSLAKKRASLPKEVQPNHGLRKFFHYGLQAARIADLKAKQFEGHSNGTRGTYTSRDIEPMRDLYREDVYPHLDLSEQGAVESKQKQLEDLVAKQQAQITALEEEKKNLVSKSEVEDIRKELAAIRRDLGKQAK